MSGLPVAMMTVPSSLTWMLALEFAAAVEPIARGHAAPLVRSERCLVGRVIDQCLERLGIAAMGELWPEDHRRAGPCGVFEPQLQRVHANLLGQDVEHALDRKRRDRRARRPVGGRFRPVAHDVVAHRVLVRGVVGREGAQARIHDRRAREGAGLELELALGGGDRAVLFDADLDPHRGARGRARGLEHLVAAHHDLHRLPGLFGQQCGDRLEIDDGLAAKAAADLRRRHANIADRHAEQFRGQRADHEMPLARRPDLGLAIVIEAGDAGMRLDIGLVHRRGLELLVDDLVGLGKACIRVADLELDPLRDIRGLGRRRLDAAGDLVLEEQRRVGLHRLVDIDDVRQYLVIDIDQRRRFLGDRFADRRDRGDRVALIERLLARHDVARYVPEILRDPLRADIFEFMVGEVLGGDHRLDPGQCLGLRGVDRADAGMRMRRADDLAVERARRREIGAVHRAPGHLWHAVRTDRPRPHPLEPCRRNVVHRSSPSSRCTGCSQITVMQRALKSKTIDPGRRRRGGQPHVAIPATKSGRIVAAHMKELHYAFCATIFAPGFGCQKIVRNSLL